MEIAANKYIAWLHEESLSATPQADDDQKQRRADKQRSEFAAKAMQRSIGAVKAKATYIAPDRLWEDGLIELFNATLRDELLIFKIFNTLAEATIVIEIL